MSQALVNMVKEMQAQLAQMETRLRALENIKPVTVPPREKLTLKKA